MTEASAELSIPLLQDVMLVQDLTLETAFRYMDYSTSGSDTAWKVGINWALNDDLRIRANRSKSVRAPNIAELYNPSSQTFRTINDYCAASFRNRINLITWTMCWPTVRLKGSRPTLNLPRTGTVQLVQALLWVTRT